MGGLCDDIIGGTPEAFLFLHGDHDDGPGAQLALQRDDIVEVFGLESAVGQELNGQRGIVLQYIENKNRFQVRVATSGGKAKSVLVKSDNLRKREDGSLAACRVD